MCVFAVSPLTSTPDKTAILHRLLNLSIKEAWFASTYKLLFINVVPCKT